MSFFILDKVRIDDLISQMELTSGAQDEWSFLYLDKKSGSTWQLTKFLSATDSSTVVVLKPYPPLTMEELVIMAMTSSNRDEILGASMELQHRELCDGLDFRSFLFAQMRGIKYDSISQFEKERILTVITATSLTDRINRRETLGKPPMQIFADAHYFNTIGSQAEEIYRLVEQGA